MNDKTRFSLMALGMCTLAGLPAGAVVVTNTTLGPFTPASDDLLQTALASVTADSLLEGGGAPVEAFFASEMLIDPDSVGEPTLRDGIFNSEQFATGNNTTRSRALFQNNESATYFLDLTASPSGYDITQIDLFSNWGGGPGRDNIFVTIDFSFVSDPNDFSQNVVTDEFYEPAYDANDADGTTQGRMSLTDLTDITATGVAAVRFTFPDGQENNAVGYAELDVIGAASGGNPLVPGDADGDGDVDDTDLGIAISNFTGPGGSGKTLADGDTDGDGDVDDTDLGVAISGFTGPLAAAVPEPTSLALLSLGGLLIARRRRA